MFNILNEIEKIGIIPVIAIDKQSRALPLADALSKGGLPLMEVMFRTEQAADCIETIAKNRPDFLIGAGTILTIDQAKKAIDVGAKYLVSPGFNKDVVAFATSNNIPIVPGCVSPTEVEMALDLGVTTLKFFPAVENGGLRAMQLLSGPYPAVKFVPTGDMLISHCKEYLSFSKVAAVGGDFMLSYKDIYSDNYDKITQDVENTILEYLNLHISHVGLNSNSKENANVLANKLAKTLKLTTKEYDKSTFAGNLFEIMHAPYYYQNGHIAVGTTDATRAYNYLKRNGCQFYENEISFDKNGKIICAYIKENYGNFALHLLQD